jgi:hypothetical protein
MYAALLALIATVNAEPLPDWAIERIEESTASVGAPPVVAVTGPDADAAAKEASEALGREVTVVRGLDPLRSMDALLSQATVDCGYLLAHADGGTWTLHHRGECGLSAPPQPEPEPVVGVEPPPPPHEAPPRAVVHFAEFRLGGTGVSWSTGPSVDFRTGPRTSLGGSGLLVINGYFGADIGLSACAYAKSFERGFYGRAGLGTSWLLSTNGPSGSGRLTAGPAWRIQLGEPGHRGEFGVLDIGFELRGEAGFGDAPLDAFTFGGAFTVSGGLGL